MAKNYKVTLYHFNELSESAKSRVIDKERENPYNWGTISQEDDARDRIGSLKGFCDAMDLWYEYSYDYSHTIKWGFRYDNDDEIADKVGKYLMRYLNNHYYDIREKKYYYTKGYYDENRQYHYKYRYSNFQYTEGNCPFSGRCYDEDLLKPIFDWYKNPNWNKSLRELLQDCFDYFIECWDNEDDYRMSDENISDLIMANWDDKLYFENGDEFNGNEDDLELIAA